MVFRIHLMNITKLFCNSVAFLFILSLLVKIEEAAKIKASTEDLVESLQPVLEVKTDRNDEIRVGNRRKSDRKYSNTVIDAMSECMPTEIWAENIEGYINFTEWKDRFSGICWTKNSQCWYKCRYGPFAC